MHIAIAAIAAWILTVVIHAFIHQAEQYRIELIGANNKCQKETENASGLRKLEQDLRLQIEQLLQRNHSFNSPYQIMDHRRMQIHELRSEVVTDHYMLSRMHLSEEYKLQVSIKREIALKLGINLLENKMIKFEDRMDYNPRGTFRKIIGKVFIGVESDY